MKKVAIMQPYLFPYIGYFQLLSAVDEYVVYDDAQFIKGGWINRNNILIGRQKTLATIRLADASPNKLINEVDISDDFVKFLKTVNMAYSRAPYKGEVGKLLQRVCSYNDKNLARFTTNSIQEIADYIGIATKLTMSSRINKDNQSNAQGKVIAICEHLKAEVYINPVGGRHLYDKETFKSHGIELKFIKSTPIEYKQFTNAEFTPNLSIIDIMMFNSKEDIAKMLNSYELI